MTKKRGFNNFRILKLQAEVAQSVEQGTENPRVGSSILSLGTTFLKATVITVAFFIFAHLSINSTTYTLFLHTLTFGVDNMNLLSKSPSYIIRNPYSYCFRIKVPVDIQKYVGKKELRYSLKTSYLGVAKQKARCLAGQVQSVFRMLKNGDLTMNLSEEKIQELVNNYIKQSVERINNLFNEGPGDKILPYTNEPGFYSYLSQLDGIREDLIANLNMGNWEMLEDEIIKFLQSQGIKDIDKSSVEYQRLCSGIHQAEIKLLPLEKRHRLNDFSYKEELPDIFPEVFDKKEPEPTRAFTVLYQIWQE